MLIISKTPLRVSLFGGGTDYPEYFNRNPGAVVGMTINRYINIATLTLTKIQPYNYRISYSKVEHCDLISNIEHPVVREVLRYFGVTDRLDISVMADLPASGSGLGSSSSFTVGMILMISELIGRQLTRIDIAKIATHIEKNVLQENVGVQDQLHAAFGGLNRFDFSENSVRITPLQLPTETMLQMNESMFLVHTGIARRSTNIIAQQIADMKVGRTDSDLRDLYNLTEESTGILQSGAGDVLSQIGKMLVESWNIKRSLCKGISNTEIDDLYRLILEAGALGAKLCGAGGGGFFMALVAQEDQESWLEKLGKLIAFPIKIDTMGATIIHRNGE